MNEESAEIVGRSYWDTVANRWNRTQPQRLWRLHSDAVNARLIEDWLPVSDRGRLLKTDAFDEAVSVGLVECLSARCRRLVTTDLAMAALRAARNNGAEIVVAGDTLALPFASGSFDSIVSLSTLDHFSTEAQLLASIGELRRVSAPGARLVLTLDNPTNPIIRLRGAVPFRWLDRLGVVPYFVGVSLRAERLRAVIQEADFEIEAETVLMHAPRLLAVALGRGLDRRAGARLSTWWLRRLMSFEQLEHYPTRFWTGHFLAIMARAPASRSLG